MIIDKKLRTALYNRLAPKRTSHFLNCGDVQQSPNGVLVHQDNGSNVLGVAHLDYVLHSKPKINRSTGYVSCPQLDDRLGAWVLLDLLPAMGIKIDVLLTDNEELGNSTAEFYEPTKEYNWLVEFDRAGLGAVLYNYECAKSVKILEDCGYPVENGSFSDICKMYHMGITGFNLGVGYHGQHSLGCFADLTETLESVDRFVKLYTKYSDTRIEYDKVECDKFAREQDYIAWPRYNVNYYTDNYRNNRWTSDSIQTGYESHDTQYPTCDICREYQIGYLGVNYCPTCDFEEVSSLLGIDDTRDQRGAMGNAICESLSAGRI